MTCLQSNEDNRRQIWRRYGRATRYREKHSAIRIRRSEASVRQRPNRDILHIDSRRIVGEFHRDGLELAVLAEVDYAADCLTHLDVNISRHRDAGNVQRWSTSRRSRDRWCAGPGCRGRERTRRQDRIRSRRRRRGRERSARRHRRR